MTCLPRIDRPWWRNNRLFVGHNDVASLVWLPHQVKDALVFGQLEVKVGLHPAVMQVGGHRVPDRPFGELRVAHQQLAGFADFGVQKLDDDALVGGLTRAHLDAAVARRARVARGVRGATVRKTAPPR